MSRINFKLRLPALVTAIAACVLMASAAGAQAAPIGAYTTKGAWNFVSAPNLHPPILGTTQKTQFSKLAPGYFMTANFKNLAANQPMTGQSGPLILDHNLQPVWFDPVGVNALAGNLQVQRFNGKPALSWWQGVVTASGDTTSGEDVVVDQHYRHIATLKGADGWVISEHEMLISGQNAWVTAYKNVPMNLTRLRRLGQRSGARRRPCRNTASRAASCSIRGTRSTRAAPRTSRCPSQSRRRSRASRGMRITSTRSS